MYECPNCGGNLKFDIASQQMACAFCGTHLDPYSVKKILKPLYSPVRSAEESFSVQITKRRHFAAFAVQLLFCPAA